MMILVILINVKADVREKNDYKNFNVVSSI